MHPPRCAAVSTSAPVHLSDNIYAQCNLATFYTKDELPVLKFTHNKAAKHNLPFIQAGCYALPVRSVSAAQHPAHGRLQSVLKKCQKEYHFSEKARNHFSTLLEEDAEAKRERTGRYAPSPY